MFNRNNNQGPMADPDNLRVGFLNIDMNRPPYTPNIQAPIQEMQPYIPYISGALAGTIQEEARENPLRTYLFNMAAQNSFANEYFSNIVGMAVEMASWLHATQNQGTASAIEIAVREVLDFVCAQNCEDDPPLQAWVTDIEIQNGLIKQIDTFKGYARQIQQWLNSANSRNRGGGGWGNRASNSGGGWGGRQSGGSAFSTSSKPVGNSNTGSQWTSRPKPGANSNTQQPTSNRFSGTSTQSQFSETRNNNKEETNMQNDNAIARLGADLENWIPGKEFPYFLAYNPAKERAFLVMNKDGTTTPVYEPIDETDMDYNQHATPNAFGPAPMFTDLSRAANTMKQIREGITTLRKEVQQQQNSDKPVITTTINQDWAFETSITAAWMTSTMKRLHVEQQPDVYRTYAIVADPVITLADESDLIRRLSKCKTFTGLADTLNDLGGEMSPELFTIVNRRMTELCNRKVQLELGLASPLMTNFRTDISKLIEILERDGGAVYRGAFLRNQADDIVKTLQTPSQAVASANADAMMAGMTFPEGKKPTITYVSSSFSFTYIDCMSWEIQLEVGVDTIPAKVTPEKAQIMYDLVKSIFDDAKNFESSDNMTLALSRHLIKTRDGRILEATRGSLVEDSYLITLVG
jgi:hypothetical protein